MIATMDSHASMRRNEKKLVILSSELQEIQQYVQKETAGATHTDPFEVHLHPTCLQCSQMTAASECTSLSANVSARSPHLLVSHACCQS